MKRVTGDGGSSLWMMHRLWRSHASWRKAGKDKLGQARPQKYKCLAMNDWINVESLSKYRTVHQESKSHSSCSRSTMRIQFSNIAISAGINCWLHIRDFVCLRGSTLRYVNKSNLPQLGTLHAWSLQGYHFPSVSHSFSVPRPAREVGWPPAVNCLDLLALFRHVTIAYFQEAFRIFMTYVRIITLSGIYHPRKSQQACKNLVQGIP